MIQKRTLFIILIALSILMFIFIKFLPNNDYKKVYYYKMDQLVHLNEPSPNGKYFILSEKHESEEKRQIRIIETETNQIIGEFSSQSSAVGEIDWLSDSEKLIYSDLESPLILYDVIEDKKTQIQIKGYPPNISPNEKYAAVRSGNQLKIIAIDQFKIIDTIKFEDEFHPKKVVGWTEDEEPKYVVGPLNGDESILKLDQNGGVNILSAKPSGSSALRENTTEIKFALFNNHRFIYHDKNSDKINFLDMQSNQIKSITNDNLYFASINPNGEVIGGISDGVYAYDFDGNLLYSDELGDSQLLLWEWISDDKFVIVYRKLYFSGLFGETNRIELHDISEGKRISRSKITKIYPREVYKQEEGSKIFVRTTDNEIIVYDLLK